MIKLYIFESVEDAKRFDQPLIDNSTVHVTVDKMIPGTWAPLKRDEDKLDKSDDAPEERPRKKYTKHKKAAPAKKRGTGTGHGVPHCKICGQAGVSSKTHPNHGVKSAVAKSKMGRKRPTCRNCGKPGHMAKTCPQGKSHLDTFQADEERPAMRCYACQSEEHNTKDCPEVGAAVSRLQGDGLDSLRIAAEPHLPLKVVNLHWNRERFDEAV